MKINRIVAALLGCIILFASNRESLLAKIVWQEEKKEANQSPDATPAHPTVASPLADKTLEQVYRLTTKAFSKGEYPLAHELVATLCIRAPNEFRFHFLKGEILFAQGQMAESVAAFDDVIRLQPEYEPQLWQRGLALYYAGRFEDGVKQFETHQTVNSQDVENAVWHLLCAARISNVQTAREKLIPIKHDSRVPMSEIYEMFAGRVKADEVLAAAEKIPSTAASGSDRQSLQMYYAHLYVGLYQEMMGEKNESLTSMKRAVKINPLAKDNFMGQVAAVHVKLRETMNNLVPAK